MCVCVCVCVYECVCFFLKIFLSIPYSSVWNIYEKSSGNIQKRFKTLQLEGHLLNTNEEKVILKFIK